eukprot:397710-Amorphochlora_amoeboformis.AAC.1
MSLGCVTQCNSRTHIDIYFSLEMPFRGVTWVCHTLGFMGGPSRIGTIEGDWDLSGDFASPTTRSPKSSKY